MPIQHELTTSTIQFKDWEQAKTHIPSVLDEMAKIDELHFYLDGVYVMVYSQCLDDYSV